MWISAILTIIGGVPLLLISPVGPGRQSRGHLVGLGIIVLLIGLITAAVASRLGKGGNGARLIVSVSRCCRSRAPSPR